MALTPQEVTEKLAEVAKKARDITWLNDTKFVVEKDDKGSLYLQIQGEKWAKASSMPLPPSMDEVEASAFAEALTVAYLKETKKVNDTLRSEIKTALSEIDKSL